jgi:hypothetical protein
VVFVTMGEHDRVNPVASFDQPAKVWQDDIDAIHVRLREHEPCVDDHDSTVLFDRETIAPNLTESA